MVKRVSATAVNFDMSPEDYRAKWGLPKDYPMVAPAYAETRRMLAHSIGLGRKKEAEPSSNAKAKPKLSIAAAKDDLPGGTPTGRKRGRPAKAKDEAPVAAPEMTEVEAWSSRLVDRIATRKSEAGAVDDDGDIRITAAYRES